MFFFFSKIKALQQLLFTENSGHDTYNYILVFYGVEPLFSICVFPFCSVVYIIDDQSLYTYVFPT